ncbi:MAG TPA: glycosyltransferase family 1 protein [Candidatus Scalindua sp.]|nr:glycosyltransferase family 1 protein [Candidatus Scalindua sp.]
MVRSKIRKDFYIFNNGIITERGMSGSDRRALEWSRIWQGKGHRIHLFIPQVGYKRYKSLKPNVEFVITSSLRPSRFGFFFTYLYRAFKACFKQPKIGEHSIIYSSCDLLADTLPALYMKLRNRKARWMAGLHLIAPNPFKGFQKTTTKGFVFPKLSNLYFFLSQRLIIFFMGRFVFLILVSNNGDKKFLVKKGIPQKKILVTYGGINLEEINKIKGKEKYETSFIGRLHPQKGIPDLLQAWSRVTRQLPQAKLAIIAEPNLQEYFERKIDLQELKKQIDFLGFLDGERKFKVLKSSKIFLFPSYYESFGLVACEAMACGLPVVAYDLPIYKEIYPQGMVKVPIGNIEKFSQEVVNLLTDNEKRERLSHNALSIARKFSWDKTADAILERL